MNTLKRPAAVSSLVALPCLAHLINVLAQTLNCSMTLGMCTGNMAAIMEVNESMNKKFLQFEPAPRRGEPEVCLQQDHLASLNMMLLLPQPRETSAILLYCCNWSVTVVLLHGPALPSRHFLHR